MLKSENARLSGWVYVDIRGRDLSSAVRDMQRAVAQRGEAAARLFDLVVGPVRVPRARDAKLKIVVPATLVIIFVLLYLHFRRFAEALAHHGDAAVRAGRRLLADVPARLQHVDRVRRRLHRAGRRGGGVRRRDAGLHEPGGRHGARRATSTIERDLIEAIVEGAVLRVRPMAMTVAVIIAGLLPIMFGSGTGSEVMQRIAAPMVGGMITAPLLSMFVVPAAYLLIRARLRQREGIARPALEPTAT